MAENEAIHRYFTFEMISGLFGWFHSMQYAWVPVIISINKQLHQNIKEFSTKVYRDHSRSKKLKHCSRARH